MLVSQMIDVFKASPKACSFIVDFDGCLSQIVADPDSAEVVEGGRQVLSALTEIYGLVAIVTGRRAEDVHSRLQVPGIRYIGLYGAEELVGTDLVQHADAERWRGMASRSARDAEAMITAEGLVGCMVEFKDLAVSVHFRNAQSLDAESNIVAWALGVAAKRGLVVVLGRKVVELRPAGMSKASVVDSLVLDADLRYLLIAGDDSSDVEAMRRAGDSTSIEALKVGVRSAEEPPDLVEVADVLVEDPLALVALLRRFVH